MSQASTLNRIGTKVRIDINRVRDRIPANLLNQLKDDPRGKVVNYKMTDGQGIGVVLELSNGTQSWFFEDELCEISDEYELDSHN